MFKWYKFTMKCMFDENNFIVIQLSKKILLLTYIKKSVNKGSVTRKIRMTVFD